MNDSALVIVFVLKEKKQYYCFTCDEILSIKENNFLNTYQVLPQTNQKQCFSLINISRTENIFIEVETLFHFFNMGFNTFELVRSSFHIERPDRSIEFPFHCIPYNRELLYDKNDKQNIDFFKKRYMEINFHRYNNSALESYHNTPLKEDEKESSNEEEIEDIEMGVSEEFEDFEEELKDFDVSEKQNEKPVTVTKKINKNNQDNQDNQDNSSSIVIEKQTTVKPNIIKKSNPKKI